MPSERGPGLQSLANEVAGRCKAAGLTPPSAKTVKARVRARDQVWLARRREGAGKARSLALLTGAHPGAAAPWERVQIDSTPCDIRLVREIDRTVIGRPTVTFAIDIYSRAVLGFSVSLQSASTVTVATCLAHACLPKQDWLAAARSHRRALAGLGQAAASSNTTRVRKTRRQASSAVCGCMASSARCAPNGHPEHHGTIERLIGTMMRRIHERRGTTFSSVNERGDGEPERLACLSLPELEQVVALEIDSYNHTHPRRRSATADRSLPRLRTGGLTCPTISGSRLACLRSAFCSTFCRTSAAAWFEPASGCSVSITARATCWGCGGGKTRSGSSAIVVYDPRSLATVWVVDDVDR